MFETFFISLCALDFAALCTLFSHHTINAISLFNPPYVLAACYSTVSTLEVSNHSHFYNGLHSLVCLYSCIYVCDDVFTAGSLSVLLSGGGPLSDLHDHQQKSQ